MDPRAAVSNCSTPADVACFRRSAARVRKSASHASAFEVRRGGRGPVIRHQLQRQRARDADGHGGLRSMLSPRLRSKASAQTLRFVVDVDQAR